MLNKVVVGWRVLLTCGSQCGLSSCTAVPVRSLQRSFPASAAAAQLLRADRRLQPAPAHCDRSDRPLPARGQWQRLRVGEHGGLLCLLGLLWLPFLMLWVGCAGPENLGFQLAGLLRAGGVQ